MAGTCGARARITKKGIDYANAEIHKNLGNKLNAMHIPDLEGNGRHYEWYVRSIENRGCSLPQSSMNFVPNENALSWSMDSLSLKLKGDWKAKYRQGFVKFADGGSVEVEVKGVTLQVIIRLGADVNGRPSVSLASCNVDIDDVIVEFHGGAAFVYNLFSDVCGKKIGHELKKEVYKAMEKFVNKDGARKLSLLKVSVPMSRRFTLDYRLTQTPSVQGNQLETDHKGKVYWTADSYEAPISPSPIPPSEEDSKMLYVWLSDFILNSLMLVGQKNNYWQYNLTSEKLPETHRYFLSTSSQQMCIGKLIPQIGKMYPNSQVEAKIVSSSAPTVKVTTEKMMVESKSNINLIAHTTEHKAPFLLNLNLNLSLSLQLSIVSEKVTSKIVDHRIEVEIVKSAVGKLDENVLNPILSMLMSFYVIPKLQNILDKGLDLPLSDEVKFENPEIKLLDGSLVIGTDVQVL